MFAAKQFHVHQIMQGNNCTLQWRISGSDQWPVSAKLKYEETKGPPFLLSPACFSSVGMHGMHETNKVPHISVLFPPGTYAKFPMLAGCVLLVFAPTWMLNHLHEPNCTLWPAKFWSLNGTKCTSSASNQGTYHTILGGFTNLATKVGMTEPKPK